MAQTNNEYINLYLFTVDEVCYIMTKPGIQFMKHPHRSLL